MKLAGRIVVVAIAVVIGYAVGAGGGLLVGVALDRVSGNEFASVAMATLPIGAIVGAALGLLIGLRLTRMI